MNDALMPDASFGSDELGNGMADAGMGDASMDADLGFDRIYLHHVGQDLMPFIDAFGSKVLPALR